MESEKAKSTSAEEFKNLFKRHVKPKKLHEIERFCRVVTTLTTKTYCQQVFDVGSGLGHLARFLTYGCQLSLTCVDCNDTFGESAT
jgi:methylase of polypeptide subunit release factors